MSSASIALLVGYSLIASLIYGIDGVQLVLVSNHLLGMGAGCYGYPLAGLGVAVILMAPFVVRLERRPRLDEIILLRLAAYRGPTLVFLAVHLPATGSAITAGRILRVDGPAFIATLTDSPPSTALLNGAALRLGRTHPGMRVTTAGRPDPLQ